MPISATATQDFSCAIVMMPRISQVTVLGLKLTVRRADDGGKDDETVANLMTEYFQSTPTVTDLLGLCVVHGDGIEKQAKRLDGLTAALQTRSGR